jgi:hypothetical protein
MFTIAWPITSTAESKVENSAQVLSCLLKFVGGEGFQWRPLYYLRIKNLLAFNSMLNFN